MTSEKNEVVEQNELHGTVGIQAPDIDEDAGFRALPYCEKYGDIEKGQVESSVASTDEGSDEKVKKKRNRIATFFKPHDENEEKKPSVGWLTLFRFASTFDKIAILVGTFAGLGHGVIMPMMIVVFGEIIAIFTDKGLERLKCDQAYLNQTLITLNITSEEFIRRGKKQFTEDIDKQIMYFIIIAVAGLVLGYLQAACWNSAAEYQVRRIRIAFFTNLLRQDIGWYDQQQSGAVTAKFNEDINQIRKGIGEKVGLVLQHLGTFVGGMVIGFIYGWKLALVILAFSPLLAAAAITMVKFAFTQSQGESSAYGQAGAIAQEVLSSIRTVAAFGGQKSEVTRYADNLDAARAAGTRKGAITGFMMGFTFFVIMCAYALGFTYGVQLINEGNEDNDNAVVNGSSNGTVPIEAISTTISVTTGTTPIITTTGISGENVTTLNNITSVDTNTSRSSESTTVSGSNESTTVSATTESPPLSGTNSSTPTKSASSMLEEDGYNIGSVTITFFAILMGTFSIGMSISSIQAVATARSAAFTVFDIIDRIPPVDAFSKRGHKRDPASFTGRLELKNIAFRYPSRPDVPILRNVNVSIEPGSTVAFVGPSGCGKSTIVQLIQRFYDPEQGQVLVDGVDLRDYNIFWFRTLIGSVSQEPVLFNTSIFENIQYGNPGCSKDQIIEAAKMANAHDFISSLPNGYGTPVGEQGTQLSGGQKQRIAIARALVRNPKILLLDEATSALDTESEAIVQDALDKASEGRTTIAIAHRLSTIMNADRIFVVNQGVICESGTHSELIALGRIYAGLVEAQQSKDKEGGGMSMNQVLEHRAALANKKRDKTDSKDPRKSLADSQKKLSHSEQKEIDKTLIKEHFSATRLWKLAKPETPFFILGFIASCVCGAVWPVFAIIFSKMIAAFTACSEDERIDKARTFSLTFLGIGAVLLAGMTIMMWLLAIAGERLVARIRVMAFNAILRQEIGWFDDDENSTGALTSRLSTQAAAVKDATGASMAQMGQAVSCLVTAIIIGFIHEWRITLIMIAFTPLVLIGSLVQAQAAGDVVKQDKFVETAAKALVSSTANIRTVTSLGIYQIFIDMFKAPLFGRHKRELLKIQIGAVAFGSSEASLLFAYAASYSAGANFIVWGWSDFEDIFTALGAIMFSAFSMGQANAMAPDQKKAKIAVAEIFKLLDRTPEIEWDTDRGVKSDSFDGKAQMKAVEFYYPTRPNAKIFKGLNLEIPSGKTIAVVGPSGGGKSTIIQLLERFYDCTAGKVILDDNELKAVNLSWARSNISLVSQEPTLFDRTIAENITYGIEGTKIDNSQAAIEKAATMSNIHKFISQLPDGYNTRVGEKGSQLSGGQKQRIAIARALIRNPKMLLLDEATSALDSESENVVQEALDQARQGRTSVVIAHRLSTIEDADLIAVIQNGVVHELGTHEELIERKDTYWSLWNAQQLTSN